MSIKEKIEKQDVTPSSKKKFLYLFYAFFFLHIFSSRAQVIIIQQPILPFQFNITDVWKVQIINQTGNVVAVYLSAQVTGNGGIVVCSARTAAFELKTGVSVFTNSNLNILGYTYTTSDQYASVKSSGLFPYGPYNVCIKVMKEGAIEELASSCLEIVITPISPPLLLNPSNQSEIYTTFPVLTWLGPSPASPSMNITYDLKLVEIVAGQSAFDAVQRNPAHYQEFGLNPNYLQYPPNAANLEVGKKYAWQITAKSGSSGLGQTEVWEFTVKKFLAESEKPVYSDNIFIKPKKTLDGSYVYIQNEIRVDMDDPYSSGKLNYSIYDVGHNQVSSGDLSVLSENHYLIVLDKHLKKGAYYYLETVSSKKEKQFILFRLPK